MFYLSICGKFILFYLVIYGSLAEPHCSRFPYEEALLEKMVRLEFKVEQMDNGFKAMESKIMDELTRLQGQRDALSTITNTMKNDIKHKLNVDFVNLVAEIKEIDKEIDKQISNLLENAKEEIGQIKQEALRMTRANVEGNEAKISRMSMDLQNMLNSTRQDNEGDGKGEEAKQSIYFSASSPHDRDPARNEIIKFTDILDNKGDGYDKTTGIFTAPVPGTYPFSCQVCGKDPHDIRIGFVQDGTDKQPFESKDVSNYSCGTAIFVSWLEDGAQVWVKSLHGHSTGSFFSDSTMRTVFSGIVLS